MLCDKVCLPARIPKQAWTADAAAATTFHATATPTAAFHTSNTRDGGAAAPGKAGTAPSKTSSTDAEKPSATQKRAGNKTGKGFGGRKGAQKDRSGEGEGDGSSSSSSKSKAKHHREKVMSGQQQQEGGVGGHERQQRRQKWIYVQLLLMLSGCFGESAVLITILSTSWS